MITKIISVFGYFADKKKKVEPKIRKTTDYSKSKRTRLKESLFNRDGNLCFYSKRPMTHATATVEHLLAKSVGGSGNKENLVLCLQEHNSKVGNASLREKLEYRDFLTKQKNPEEAKIRTLELQLRNALFEIITLKEEIKSCNKQRAAISTKLGMMKKLKGLPKTATTQDLVNSIKNNKEEEK